MHRPALHLVVCLTHDDWHQGQVDHAGLSCAGERQHQEGSEEGRRGSDSLPVMVGQAGAGLRQEGEQSRAGVAHTWVKLTGMNLRDALPQAREKQKMPARATILLSCRMDWMRASGYSPRLFAACPRTEQASMWQAVSMMGILQGSSQCPRSAAALQGYSAACKRT